jgi:DNA-directed RNA polymerase subunit M/transcription elongation factor TFIIS
MAIAPERVVMQKQFLNACVNHEGFRKLTPGQQSVYGRRMERSCFNATIASCLIDGIDRIFIESKFVARYSSSCNRVLVNLDPLSSVGSTYLVDKLLTNEISPYDVGTLSVEDLCPNANELERANIKLRQEQKMERKVSHDYVCRKCGGNETIPLEYQGRAVDEGASHSIKCINCENVWRR